MDLLKGLNIKQKQAVETLDGAMLILAGAGSGKTKTLTHRIANIIAHGTPSERILAVTFTNKAAREMRERLAELLGADASDRFFMPWMGTFHGICVRILRLKGEHIGIAPNFVIYDETDRQNLIKRICSDLNFDSKTLKPSSVSSVISNAKNELQTAEDFADSAHWGFEQKCAEVFLRYEKERRKANALDFDDLLSETVRLLKTAPEVRDFFREKFEHILIDEYQDTNSAQYQIVKMLVNDQENICVVGDDWQSIYSWRGADFTNILNFEKDFPRAKIIKLEQNYRSTENILNAAHAVISKNEVRSDKKLFTKIGKGEEVRLWQTHDEQEEASRITSKIFSEKSVGLRKYQDFAILYRTNAQSRSLEEALRHAGIEYKIFGGMRFYDRKVIKDLLAYLRVIYNPLDQVAFERIANVPARGLGKVSLEKFLNWQSENGLDLISSLLAVDGLSTMQTRARNSLKNLGEILRLGQILNQDGTSPAEILEKIIDKTNYKYFEKLSEVEQKDKEENIGELISDAKIYADLAGFLENAALMSSADSESDDQVSLMTIHAAKGLEFPVVFLAGMEEGVFPHSRVFDSDKSELEEERRLCYVGMTRAREELILTCAGSRAVFGQRNYSSPSRFITEAGLEIASKYDEIYGASSNKFSDDFDQGSSQFDGFDEEISYEEFNDFYDEGQYLQIGDRVKSPVFGAGTVRGIDGSAVEIEFSGGKIRKLNAEFARLEKISD
ncbi:MAG: UvrD-helicase domain-containing protein [bacterium]|nr:UvrD-helicase domain-containing protein [bacterium]